MCCDASNFSSEMVLSVTHPAYLQYTFVDTFENLLDDQKVKLVQDIANCGFTNSFFLIGAPTNLLTMIIFYRQGLRDRMNLCLFSLAFVDLMYLTSLFVMASFCFIAIAFPDQKEFWKLFFMEHCIYFVYSFGLSSGCLTMIIAIERCVCVMFPLKAVSVISTKAMASLLSVTLILIQLLCSVYIIKERINVVTDSFTGENAVFLTNTELYLSHKVFSIVENVVLPCVSFLSYAFVFLTTAITVAKLRKAMIWRKSAANSYLKGQAVLVQMLVGISCVYVLCTTHNIVLAVARFIVAEFRVDGKYRYLFLATHVVSHIPVMFNSSVNFFVYAKMSSRFRRELRALCLYTGTTIPSKSDVVNSMSHLQSEH